MPTEDIRIGMALRWVSCRLVDGYAVPVFFPAAGSSAGDR